MGAFQQLDRFDRPFAADAYFQQTGPFLPPGGRLGGVIPDTVNIVAKPLEEGDEDILFRIEPHGVSFGHVLSVFAAPLLFLGLQAGEGLRRQLRQGAQVGERFFPVTRFRFFPVVFRQGGGGLRAFRKSFARMALRLRSGLGLWFRPDLRMKDGPRSAVLGVFAFGRRFLLRHMVRGAEAFRRRFPFLIRPVRQIELPFARFGWGRAWLKFYHHRFFGFRLRERWFWGSR